MAALNQAISNLRKVLKDDKKAIIQTVPKRGYLLNAKVSFQPEGKSAKTSGLHRRVIAIISTIAVVVIVTIFLMLRDQSVDGTSNVQSAVDSSKLLETPFSDLKFVEEETPLNTIITKAPDGTVYKLIAIGDRRPEFYVNGNLVEDQQKHDELVSALLRKLWERQKQYADSIALKKE